MKNSCILLGICLLFACNSAVPTAQQTDSLKNSGLVDKSTNVDDQSVEKNSNGSINQLIDTNKLKADVGNILNSIASGKPDTNQIKKAGADILSTTTAVLSDSGISKLYGNDNDPAVQAAKNALIKMRNASGLNQNALDSIQRAAAKLMQGH